MLNPRTSDSEHEAPLIIYAVRHCERADKINPNWRVDSSHLEEDNPPLSQRGRQQAKELYLR